jgi:glycerol-3-phosphate acyltransferase PlsY
MMNYLLLATAYLLGSIPFGVVLARARNINLRSEGSGNIGATNVARVLGKKAGLLTLCGDMAKGAVAVALADHWMASAEWVALAGLMAFLGHLHSVFIGFKGGKGVATGLGIFLYLMPVPAALSVAVFAAGLWTTGFVSVGSILASLFLPVAGVIFKAPLPFIGLAVVAGGLVVLKHRDNIERLMAGTETRFLKK